MLSQTLGFKGNPFEHYTAETEPDIASYAVRPPYLQAISDRVTGLTSFILFGDRGAGKSATRITVYNEVWASTAASTDGGKRPFVINLTDFSALQEPFKKDKLTEREIVNVVAFAVVEQVLVWLSSLEDEVRSTYIETLDPEERTLIFALLKGFYLTVGEMDRDVSNSEALRLLNSAWTTKSAVWAGQRWEALSKIIAAAVAALTKKTVDESVDIAAPAEALLRSLLGDSPNAPRAILGKLVDLVRLFSFSGIAILVDKVDETPVTASSAEATTKLIHPLLAHIQLMEVPGFCWVMFLWARVKDHFNSDKYPVRLDKLAHANITWSDASLRGMIEARLKFFSEGRLDFSGIFSNEVDADAVFQELISIATNSPRELIKLMDTIVREHDARTDVRDSHLDTQSVELGVDKYVVETIGGFFPDKPLQQFLRLGRIAFVNRDVQGAFKIGDQSARVKIRNWEDVGLVRQSGTQAPASDLGGQPAYRFIVADARVERIIKRKLIDTVGAEIETDREIDEVSQA
jgi:hypothetical protein